MYRTDQNANHTTAATVQALSLDETNAAITAAEAELKAVTWRLQMLKERRRKLLLGGAARQACAGQSCLLPAAPGLLLCRRCQILAEGGAR